MTTEDETKRRHEQLVAAAPEGAKHSSTITHAEHGHVATFYPLANPCPLVSFRALAWGPLCSQLGKLGRGARYGDPGYGLTFDEQLPSGSDLAAALAVVQLRLDAIQVAGQAQVQQ